MLAYACFAWLALGAQAPARAEARVVDLSAWREERIELRWAAPRAGGARGHLDAAFHRLDGQVRGVEYRLDLSPWVGRQVRLLLVLPMPAGIHAPQALRVRWRGDGVLRDGEAQAGERVVVYTATVRDSLLATRLDYELAVDSRFFDGSLRFEPHFEIETE